MKTINKACFILILFVCFNAHLYPQIRCDINEWRDSVLDKKFETKERKSEFSNCDFSFLLLDKRTEYIGYIGNDYQKMVICFDKVFKNPLNKEEYIVTGSSEVKQNKCNFQGKIQTLHVRNLIELNYGVDDLMKGKVKEAGIIVAEFEFYENAEQRGSGVFKGLLYSLWYIDNEGVLKYDDIRIDADDYKNNQFLGSWISYTTKKSKICSWGQYRVPCAGDLDIGAGEFSPNPKYGKFGW